MIARVGLMAALAYVASTAPTGQQIVQSMHDKYAGKWFKTLTFVQTTTRRDTAGKETVTTWYESAKLPGRLRIDFGKPTEGNGALYTHDSTYRIAKGALKSADAGGNPLIPTLFDVYVVPVSRTVDDLQNTLKIDLSKVNESTWDGRPVYVVGADLGNERTPQLWIDKERLVVLRQIFAANDTLFIDSHLKNYQKVGNSWVAPRCEFYINGKLIQSEDYNEIKADVPLSDDLFRPATWSSAPHWAH
jgi:outer membrane lipoprotein-sorting protein